MNKEYRGHFPQTMPIIFYTIQESRLDSKMTFIHTNHPLSPPFYLEEIVMDQGVSFK